ncbi:MAG: hypothetical protein HON78_04350 [Legionellales bacterium]|nr:hypothetical protein [Legionellales bacterium]
MKTSYNKILIINLVVLSLGACSGYEHVYHGDSYEEQCNNNKVLKTSADMDLKQSSKHKVLYGATTAKLESYTKPELLSNK